MLQKTAPAQPQNNYADPPKKAKPTPPPRPRVISGIPSGSTISISTTLTERKKSLQDQLIDACESGNIEKVSELLNSGAQPHEPNDKGMIPIYCATYFALRKRNLTNENYWKIANILFEKTPEDKKAKASMEEAKKHNKKFYGGHSLPEGKTKSAKKEPSSAISASSQTSIPPLDSKLPPPIEKENLKKISLSSGTSSSSIIIPAIDMKPRIHDPDLQGRLVAACEQGNLGEVEKILQEGADPNLPDERGKIPLFCAVWSMNTDLVNFLKRLQKNKEDLYGRCWTHNLAHYKGMFVLNPGTDNPLVLDRTKQNKFVYNELLNELRNLTQTPSKMPQEKGSHPSAIPTEQKNTNMPKNIMTFFSTPKKFQELENFTQRYFSPILTGKSNSRRYNHIKASTLGPNMLKAIEEVHKKLSKQITDELTGPVQPVKNNESIGRPFS